MKNKIRKYTIILSLIVHLIILILLQVDKLNIFQSPQINKLPPQEDPLVFDLVETPQNAKEELPEKNSDYVSDKNTKAADQVENEIPETEVPYQQGEVEIPQFAQQQPQQEQQNKQTEQSEAAEILSEIQQNNKSFMETFEAKKQLQTLTSENLDFQNLTTQVKNRGGMSLNTYQWEFAPYLLEMKRKVQSHNNPPFAFTHLGAIGGDILLRFKVLQDGTVKDLEILNSTAHYSLEDTSKRAIQFSAPFKPLPENFPKEYLEITALFSYILRK